MINKVSAISSVISIDANKEQHIQRISSGESSNQLKLKMDKFGSPTTNVIVEVRKGIKVDVIDTEAYRYGGDEFLASGTLPYTTFTAEAQEITVNLNQSFQLLKGELYSVVVKQENGIVNAQNFYRLYCDSTQYSEAFSVVAVNGEGRVRSKLMPYCVSEGFLDNCLVKEKKTTYELGKKTLYTRTSNSGRLTFTNGYEEHTVQNVQVFSSANLIVAEGSVRAEVCSLYFGDKEKLIIKPNDNGTIRYQYNISPGSYRIFGNSNRYGQSASMMLNDFVVNEYAAIIYPKPIITHPPRRREEIGGETEITIFGFHIENKWVHRTLTTQTAQTGSIPLGNAVGYKTDYLSDGTEILIPYYNKPG